MSNLVIPLFGTPTVMAHGVQPDTVQAALRVMVDEQPTVLVGCGLYSTDNPEFHNDRARRAVLMLTGIHIVLSGEITLFDLDDDTIRGIIDSIEGLHEEES